MLLLAWLLFYLPLLGLLHSYLFYPYLLRRLARNKEVSSETYSPTDSALPMVSVLCSFFNEDKVITKKLASLEASSYPKEKLAFYFGSDKSTDGTNEALKKFARNRPNVHFFPFAERRGKPSVINELAAKAILEHGRGKQHILLLTDANVIHSPACLYQLVRHFKKREIALVDAHMQHTGVRAGGISKTEDQYISSEVYLKHHEGKVWGTMIGPFGGCYALRSDFFTPVPERFLVDDFFIAMRVFEKGGQAINDLKAYCFEAVNHTIHEEFRRKKRISAGNFQNLRRFANLAWPPTKPLAFAFISHKILRWMGPFFMVKMILGLLILSFLNNITGQVLLLFFVCLWFLLPVMDALLSRMGINWYPLRTLRYFLVMNIALLAGFFKYLKGIKNNVWQPTKRS